eukprot:SAG11_NODE_151_length_14583_cov_21.306200_17_plen_70_part_00
MSLSIASRPASHLPVTRPIFVEPAAEGAAVLELEQAWHPTMAKNNDDFIPNDTAIGGETAAKDCGRFGL